MLAHASFSRCAGNDDGAKRGERTKPSITVQRLSVKAARRERLTEIAHSELTDISRNALEYASPLIVRALRERRYWHELLRSDALPYRERLHAFAHERLGADLTVFVSMRQDQIEKLDRGIVDQSFILGYRTVQSCAAEAHALRNSAVLRLRVPVTCVLGFPIGFGPVMLYRAVDLLPYLLSADVERA